jgi:hypothetical protein
MKECDPDNVTFSKFDTRTRKLVEYCCLVHPSRIAGHNYAGADDGWQAKVIAYGAEKITPTHKSIREDGVIRRRDWGFSTEREWWKEHGHWRLGIALGIYKDPSPYSELRDVQHSIDPKHYNKQIEYTVLEYPVTYADYIEWQALRFCSPV